MNELLSNLEKVHTTEMGEARIKKNLNIDCADVVAYCVEKIKKKLRNSKRGKELVCYSRRSDFYRQRLQLYNHYCT